MGMWRWSESYTCLTHPEGGLFATSTNLVKEPGDRRPSMVAFRRLLAFRLAYLAPTNEIPLLHDIIPSLFLRTQDIAVIET